jgi:isoleucyl-tRNA synthetase
MTILKIQAIESLTNADLMKENPMNPVRYSYTFDDNFYFAASSSPLDACILSNLRDFAARLKMDVKTLDLCKLVKHVCDFVEVLFTKYCRLNKLNLENNLASIHTLFFVFSTVSILCAPFFPLCCEAIATQLDGYYPHRQKPDAKVTTPANLPTNDNNKNANCSVDFEVEGFLLDLVNSQAAKSLDQCVLKTSVIPNLEHFKSSQVLE